LNEGRQCLTQLSNSSSLAVMAKHIWGGFGISNYDLSALRLLLDLQCVIES